MGTRPVVNNSVGLDKAITPRRTSGFSMLELIIVIAIIMVVAGITVEVV